MTKPVNLRDEQAQMILDCMNRRDRMSDWERQFIQSVSVYFNGGGFLSDKQKDIIDKLWERVTKKN